MLEWRDVYSSNVSAIGYDAATREMRVRWKRGKESVYSGVEPSVANEVMNAPSVGSALRETMRGAYMHRYADDA